MCRNCTLYKDAELPIIGRSRVRVCISCTLSHAPSPPHPRQLTNGKRSDTPQPPISSIEERFQIMSTPTYSRTSSDISTSSETQLAVSAPSVGQGDGAMAGGPKVENMLMDLLSRTTDTQQQLATQQGSMFETLGSHTSQIDKLANAVARMEAKLEEKMTSKSNTG